MAPSARFRADVGVRHGRIVSIGRIRERGRETSTPKAVVAVPDSWRSHPDDAYIFWDPAGTSVLLPRHSTTVVMGNWDGFTLAHARRRTSTRRANLQRARTFRRGDGGGDRLGTGRPFPEFLDTLESLPKGINSRRLHRPFGAAHLRDGERPSRSPRTEDDLRAHGA